MSDIRKIERAIEVLANDLTYIPNGEQRKVKEAFWVRFNENPLCEPQDVSLSVSLRVIGDGRLERWWPQPGFKEWFRNQEEFRERASILAHMALDTIQSILVNENAQPSARVNAAKLAFEISMKMPKKNAAVEKYVDEKINQMDKKQLQAYLTKNAHLVPVKVLTEGLSSDSVDSAGPE